MMLAIFILSFIVLRSCNEDKVIVDNVSDRELPPPDTVRIVGKDIPVPFPVEVIKWKERKPDSIAKVDFVPNLETGSVDTVKTYLTEFKDTLISGTITSKVIGTLVSSSFKFKPLFPQTILRVDTFQIKKPTAVYKERWGLYVGGIVGGSLDRFSLQPAILVKTNNNLQFSLGYELIGKTYNVGMFTKINNPFKRK